MFKIKKIIATLLAVVMMASIGSTVFADGGTELKKEAEQLLSSHLTFSDSNGDTASYALNSKIPAYSLENGVMSPSSNVEFYPVYSGKDITYIFTVNAADSDSPTYTIGEEFAAKLNAASAGQDGYCLIMQHNKLYFFNGIDAILIKEYGNNENEQLSLNNDINEIAALNLSQDMRYVEQKLCDLTIPSRNNRATMGKNLPVTSWYQGNTGLCWAATVECIGDYMVGYDKYGAYGIAQAMGIGVNAGGNTGDAQNALSRLYSVSSNIMYGIDDYTIIDKINYGRPMYMNFQAPNLGHAVTLCGYVSDMASDYFSIRVMDSNAGGFVSIRKTSGTYYLYGVNGITYTLYETVVPN